MRLRTPVSAVAWVALATACLDPTAPDPQLGFVVVSGGGISDTIGAVIADSLVIQVLDSASRPVPYLAVRFEGRRDGDEPSLFLRASGSVQAAASATVLTDDDGMASVFIELGERAGATALHVSESTSGVGDSVRVAILAGRAAELLLAPTDTALVRDEAIDLRPTARDRAGNTVTRAPTYSVTGPLVESGGAVTGDGVGVATITGALDGQMATATITVLPQGRIVVGGWARTGIRASRLDGSDALLRDVPGAILWLDAAPRGRGVAFSFARVVQGQISGPHERVTPTEIESEVDFERWPRFSDDGAWVYFEAVIGTTSEIWRARPDGSRAERVTQAPGERMGDRYPAVSHTSDRLSYSADRSATDDLGTLEVLDLGTDATTSLGSAALSSRWSPDDEWIAFVTPGLELMRVRPDGSDLASMTTAPFSEGFDWSPDGMYIIGRAPDRLPQLLIVATGEVLPLPHLGTGLSVAWYDDPNG